MKDNKLIAEFMGFVYVPEDALDYSKSWDWLMPVVQKCYKIDNEEGFDMLVEDKLSSTHKAVVEFIKEHNNER